MEQKIVFRHLLGELMDQAHEQGDTISREEVNNFLEKAALTQEQLDLICQYLTDQHVQVTGFEDSRSEEKRGEFLDQAREVEQARKLMGMAGVPAQENENTDQAQENDSDQDEQRSLELYLKELDNLHGPDEQLQMAFFQKAVQGDRDAKQVLISAYLPIVCDVASEMEKQAQEGSMPIEDLIQEGNVGLLLAMEKLEKRDTLAAYQAQLMNAVTVYMQDALGSHKNVLDRDYSMAKKVNRLNEAIHSLEEDLERSVSPEELSAFLDVPVEEINDIIRLAGNDLKM